MTSRAIPLGALRARRLSEHDLVARATQGDPIAFAETYRRHRTRIYAFCLSRLMDPALAEDATQEVFVRLLSTDPGTIRSVVPWMYGVARHVCIDIVRKRVHETAVPQEDISEGVATAGDDESVGPTLSHVALALRMMTPRYREVFVASELQGRCVDDIALMLRLRRGATYTLLSRARAAFATSYRRAAELPEACRLASSMLLARDEGRLATEDAARLSMHLSTCSACAGLDARSRREAALCGLLAWARPFPVLNKVVATLEPLLVGGLTPASIEPAVAAVTTALVIGTIFTGSASTGIADRHIPMPDRTTGTQAVARPSDTGGGVTRKADDVLSLRAELTMMAQERIRSRSRLSGQSGSEATGSHAGATARQSSPGAGSGAATPRRYTAAAGAAQSRNSTSQDRAGSQAGSAGEIDAGAQTQQRGSRGESHGPEGALPDTGADE